jgi:hypothetical protein
MTPMYGTTVRCMGDFGDGQEADRKWLFYILVMIVSNADK